MGVKNDYRVSQIVVLCKDCGQDVGLYPARHKCEQVIRPPLPPINFDKKVKRNMSTTGVSRIAVDANQWKCVTRSNSATTFDRRRKEQQQQQHPTSSRRDFVDISKNPSLEEEGIKDQDDSSLYYERFAANLPQKNPKRLWDKVRDGMMDHHGHHNNNKLPWMAPKNNNNENSSSRLWNKLMDSVQHKLHDDDDEGAESDASDWEGESHVSRVLREYYEKKRAPLPHWLMSRDDNHHASQQYDPMALAAVGTVGTVRKKPSLLEQRPSHRRHQKLWEQQQVPSQRELEREALRQVPQEDPPVLRSQTMRNPHQYHHRRRRDNIPEEPLQLEPRRRHYGDNQVAVERRWHPQHNDDEDVLDTIYGDYLSESVTRSMSERRPSPRSTTANTTNRVHNTPPMVGGYF